MNHIRFVVPGRPVPAARMNYRSKWTARSNRYLGYKNIVGWEAKAAGVEIITDQLIKVNIVAYLSGKREMDADNIAKSLLDGLNGVAWKDDKQVYDLRVQKIKVKDPRQQRAEIEILTLE